MKWIKSRNLFLNEAKIRDVILPPQAKVISQRWGDKYLDYEEVTPTNKIKQGTWKLSEDDKNEVLGIFTQSDIPQLYELFSNLPDIFVNFVKNSIDTSLLSKKFIQILKDLDLKNPNLDQILIIREPIFRKVSINDTMSSSIILKDENGPIRDENNQMVKVDKPVGEIVYTRNLINMNSLLVDYNTIIDKFIELKLEGYSKDDKLENTLFSHNQNFNNFISYASDSQNSYDVDFEIFNRDIYLKISHNPQDILNMSISRFYSSCQHLYSGGYSDRVLGNVFDPNSIPAYLIFDTPIYNNEVLLSNQLPLSRMIIRNIETFNVNDDTKLFYDRAYPDRMRSIFEKICNKYSGNENNYTESSYYYMPDVDIEDNLSDPYQDRLNLVRSKYIGKNIKSLKLTQIEDWSKVKVDPNVKIKELVIETTNLPESLFTVKLNLDWVKFKFLTIKTLADFKNLATDSYAFDKCKFATDIIAELPATVKKLQLVSCDVVKMDFSKIENLEELQLIYTLDGIEDLKKCTEGLNVKKLVISGDLAGKENKPFINSLKSKGIKIEVVGPVI